MPPLPPVRRSEPQWGQGRCGSFLLEHAKKLKLFRRGYNVATGSRHSRVGLDHSRCHGPPKTQTAGRVLCGKRRGTIILSSAAREQAWRIFQQHRNAFIRSRINSSNWGTGPCPLWEFLQLCCRLYLHSPGCSGAHLPSSIQSREECRWCISSARALARCNATLYQNFLLRHARSIDPPLAASWSLPPAPESPSPRRIFIITFGCRCSSNAA
jgi:hypothetical protein